jgi:amphi-Trp domain-containing protein
MSDLEFERKQHLTRGDAAAWLRTLADALAKGGHATLPIGPGTVNIELPEHLDAEMEVEVDGDEMQIEIEFTWSRSQLKRQQAGHTDG